MGSTVCLTESTPVCCSSLCTQRPNCSPGFGGAALTSVALPHGCLVGWGKEGSWLCCALLPFMHPSGMCRCCRAGNVAGIARQFDG